MSKLTSQLLGENYRCGPRWPAIFNEIVERLDYEYGNPSLENYRDPVKEIFFILLSARTSEVLYVRAMNKLLDTFPNLLDIALTTEKSVRKCISEAGLGGKRSQQIILIAKRLAGDLGKDPESKLRKMGPSEIFEYLTSLPGVGPKSAFCVMMWSLDMDVLPVDVNVHRIACRMGVIPPGLKHYQAQERLPRFIPDGKSREIHSLFIVHGREICTPRAPKCDCCKISDLCATGLKTISRIKK